LASERIMRAISFLLPLLGLMPLGGSAAAATGVPADGYVLGDSLGEGVAEVSHLKGLAKVSVHIRGPRTLEQFAQTPPNATVFLVLGTNDANGSISRLDKSIDDIVQAAAHKNINLIWLGPPCVRQSWDTRARDLDLQLRARFAGTAVRYVSMRDPELCSGSLQEPDGVHLKTKGYVHMWEKAVAAAGYAPAVAPAPPTRLAAARIPLPIPLPIPRRPLVSDITASIAKGR
jgi:lysophospholipase L1-like esterase